jgi:HEPN domain-containing protein
MNEKIKQWVIKAENDLNAAIKELNSVEPITDIICFHFQQCVEKYLKAFLSEKGAEFKKTHNIAELVILCKKLDKDFEELVNWEIETLTGYATELRYPDYFYIPTIEEAKEAAEKTKKAREFIRKKLGL